MIRSKMDEISSLPCNKEAEGFDDLPLYVPGEIHC